jgi:hypothetical protein
VTSDSETYRAYADAAVTGTERLGLWPVFPFYESREASGDTFVVAPRYVPEEDAKRRGGVSVRRRVNYLPSQVQTVTFPNAPRHYAPLEDHPDLFARFARLGDQEHIPTSTWLEWVRKYGVLGIRDLPGGRNEIEEVHSDFVREVRLAHRTLRLFEAATGPEAPDTESIQRLLSGAHSRPVGSDPEALEFVARHQVSDVIKTRVSAECYRAFLVRGSSWRKKQVSPLVEKWVFRSLLGALWLQFNWLTNFDRLRYCKAPDCHKHISRYAQPTKMTCDDRCRQSLSRSLRKGRV